ncbi:hypothetical protein ACFQ10_21560 [Streptomyces indonesiensis]
MRIDNVTIVDPLNGSRTRGRSIVLRNGHIASVFSSGDAPAETSMRVIEGAGRYAVPGYNEMHTHVLQKTDTRLAYATMLAQGVTGMRQMQGSEDILTYRAEQRLGLTEHAPRPLGIPGGLLLPFNAGSTDDVREEIARQWDQGADFIKMILTERDVFFAAIEAAHKRGMRIAGHLPRPSGSRKPPNRASTRSSTSGRARTSSYPSRPLRTSSGNSRTQSCQYRAGWPDCQAPVRCSTASSKTS